MLRDDATPLVDGVALLIYSSNLLKKWAKKLKMIMDQYLKDQSEN